MNRNTFKVMKNISGKIKITKILQPQTLSDTKLNNSVLFGDAVETFRLEIYCIANNRICSIRNTPCADSSITQKIDKYIFGKPK